MPTCSSCGEENPARARFCMACAAALTAAGVQEVRKTVTVVFSDLKGSTSLGEALDPESLRDVMGEYFERMRGVLHSHGAAVEKFIGDAVMAVFGFPRVREDDALRAVRAAWQMQCALQELNDELESRWGVRLLARIGVNTGEVVAGDPAADQRLVTGDPVNTAARLEQAAGPGEVLVGENTYRMVKDAVRVEAVGPFAVRGKAEPVSAYRLLEVVPFAAGVRRRMDTPMVGRDRELGGLQAALDRTIIRRGCELAVVIGEPGMGKSRLLAEFEKKIAGRARVLHGQCPAYGEGITFWPLAQVVRDAARGSAGLAGQQDADLTDAALAAFMEGSPQAAAVAARVGSALGVSSEPFPLEEIYWAARLFLTHLARESPLVVAIEDVHWAEPAFLNLLDHLSDRAQEAPLMLACSARPELPEGWVDRPARQTISLGPLTGEESTRLITNLLGSSGLSRLAQEQIRETAAGNALFIEQTLSMLADEGYLATGGHAPDREKGSSSFTVPPSISALLSARLDGLPAEERAVIERASIPGQVFSAAAVAELCDPTLRRRVGGCLHALTRKVFVEPEQNGPSDNIGRFRFHHVLIRDAAYNAMLKKLRAELHERFGSWLATLNEGALDNEELLGYHLEQAYRYRIELGPPDDHAVFLSRRAGQSLAAAGHRALSTGDIGAAAKLLKRAAALLPPDEPNRMAALVDLGAALRESGDLAGAMNVLDKAIDDAKRRGDLGLECRAVSERFEVDQWLESPGWADRALAETQRLIPQLEAIGDHLGLAKAWRVLSWVHATRASMAGWEHASRRSMQHARSAGNHREEVEVLAGLAVSAAFGPVPVSEAIRRCEEILRRVTGNFRAEGFVLGYLGLLQAMRGHFPEGRAAIRRSVQILDDIGAWRHALGNRLYAVNLEILAGDLSAAEAAADEAYRLREQYCLGDPAWWVDIDMAAIRCEQGRYQETLPLVEDLPETETLSLVLGLTVKGRALARLGHVAQGESHIRDALTRLATSDAVVIRGEALMGLGEVLALAGRSQEAVSTLEYALDLWEQKGHVIMSAKTRHALAAVVASS